uniref:Scarecrow-like protein 6 n=1 Tax=Zea mays TaxID=4577 RepID=A0A804UEV6_MAIZE
MGSVMDPQVLELDHTSSMMSPAFGSTMSFVSAMEDAKLVPFGHMPNFLLHHYHQHHPQPHATFFGSHPSLDAAPQPKRPHPMAGVYKAFSEVSPVLQFAHLTCVQAVLNELGAASRIHVLGPGHQHGRAVGVADLNLIHENLSGFARELGVFLQFAAYNVDALDPTKLVAITSGDAVAVHLPVG